MGEVPKSIENCGAVIEDHDVPGTSDRGKINGGGVAGVEVNFENARGHVLSDVEVFLIRRNVCACRTGSGKGGQERARGEIETLNGVAEVGIRSVAEDVQQIA